LSRVGEQRSGAAELLRLYAFFNPEHIPRDLVGADPEGLPRALAEMAKDRVAYDQTIGALAEYALVDATPETLSMHRLVQTMVRQSLLPAERATWVRAAALLLARRFPDRPRLPGNWRECARLLPHVAEIAARAPRSHRPRRCIGGMPQSSRVPRSACAAPPSADRPRSRAILGMAWRRLGRFDAAIESLDRARRIYVRVGGPAHLLTELREELSLAREGTVGPKP
jgi:hypothetical protein